MMTPKLFSLLQQIEKGLDLLFPLTCSAPHGTLIEAARYALFPGGKRIRPLITLAVACDLGGSVDAALMPALALELIHTYSLIHDDLPCMDNDAERRGKPSLHIAFDEGLAVLCGDFLLTKAFEIVSTAPHLTIGQRLALVSTLAHRSGGEGMIGGQVVDIAGKNTTLELQNWINEKKTGALFTAAFEIGGLSALGSDEDLDLLRTVGYHFGLAFQLLDDIHDQKESPAKINELSALFDITLININKISQKTPETKAIITQLYNHVKKSL